MSSQKLFTRIPKEGHSTSELSENKNCPADEQFLVSAFPVSCFDWPWEEESLQSDYNLKAGLHHWMATLVVEVYKEGINKLVTKYLM